MLADPEPIVREAAQKALQTVAPEMLEAEPSASPADDQGPAN
jgi:hypothetical protein